jgi:hypothetical protein
MCAFIHFCSTSIEDEGISYILFWATNMSEIIVVISRLWIRYHQHVQNGCRIHTASYLMNIDISFWANVAASCKKERSEVKNVYVGIHFHCYTP